MTPYQRRALGRARALVKQWRCMKTTDTFQRIVTAVLAEIDAALAEPTPRDDVEVVRSAIHAYDHEATADVIRNAAAALDRIESRLRNDMD